MLSIAPDHARLALERDEPFTSVTESVRSLLQVCRRNGLAAAVIVSAQTGFDFRSSVRVALKFAAARPNPPPRIRLALVVAAADVDILQAVIDVAQEMGLVCRAFDDEAGAAAWLTAG